MQLKSEMDVAEKAAPTICAQNVQEGLAQALMVLYYLLVLCVYGTAMKCDFCDRYTHERLTVVKENCSEGICKDCLKARIDPFISRICPHVKQNQETYIN